MAKHIHRKLTPRERARSKRARAAFDADKDRIVAKGQALFERYERLQDTLRSLKAEREAQGVSLGELERRTGISKTSLSRLENNPSPNPTIGTLLRIAEALGRELHVTLKPAA